MSARESVNDPVVRLFDSVRDCAAQILRHTGSEPHTRIICDSGGGQHHFQVFVNDESVAQSNDSALANAAHKCWVAMQEWSDRPDPLFEAWRRDKRESDS